MFTPSNAIPTLIHAISTLIHAISTLIHAISTLIHAISGLPWKSGGKDYYGNGEGFVFTFDNSPAEMRDNDESKNKANSNATFNADQLVQRCFFHAVFRPTSA